MIVIILQFKSFTFLPDSVKKVESLGEILREISTRLKLPRDVEQNVHRKLSNNGIYVLEPLKKASESDWAALGLPLAVARELKEKVYAAEELGLLHSPMFLTYLDRTKLPQFRHTLSAVPSNATNSTNTTISPRPMGFFESNASESSLSTSCPECGKILPKLELENHLRTVCTSKLQKSTVPFSKPAPTKAIPLPSVIVPIYKP